jgi:aminopeptidase N
MIALSNMPPTSSPVPINNTGYVSQTYEPSVKMSTYLVCFVIGEFENTTTDSFSPLIQLENTTRIVSVWTLPGFVQNGVFARDVAVKTLAFFEDLFQIAYPIQKLDLVGIPDFSAGAMENYGLVTFRMVCLCCCVIHFTNTLYYCLFCL